MLGTDKKSQSKKEKQKLVGSVSCSYFYVLVLQLIDCPLEEFAVPKGDFFLRRSPGNFLSAYGWLFFVDGFYGLTIKQIPLSIPDHGSKLAHEFPL